ncbi:unnamed protein product [[Candida] boidinii]|nr:unnamed protein product [[Candida] boidinii]
MLFLQQQQTNLDPNIISPSSSLLAFNPNGSSNTLLTSSMSRLPTSYNNDFSTATGNDFTDFNNAVDTNSAMLSTSPSVTTGVWGNGLSLNPNLEFTDLSSANATNTQNTGLLDTLSNSHLLQQQQQQQPQTNSLAPSVDMLLPQSLIDSADLVRYFNDSTNYSINPNQFFQDLNLLQETASLNSMPQTNNNNNNNTNTSGNIGGNASSLSQSHFIGASNQSIVDGQRSPILNNVSNFDWNYSFEFRYYCF